MKISFLHVSSATESFLLSTTMTTYYQIITLVNTHTRSEATAFIFSNVFILTRCWYYHSVHFIGSPAHHPLVQFHKTSPSTYPIGSNGSPAKFSLKRNIIPMKYLAFLSQKIPTDGQIRQRTLAGSLQKSSIDDARNDFNLFDGGAVHKDHFA